MARFYRIVAFALGASLLLSGNIASHLPRAAAKGLPQVRLYLAAAQGNRLQPLDAASLADAHGMPQLKIGPWSTRTERPSIITSNYGDAVAAVQYGPDGSATRARDITIRTFDASGRRIGPAFHPAVLLWIEGMSGGELYGSGYRTTGGSSLPTGFYVLNAFTGAVLYHLPADSACCGSSAYDASQHRLYVLNEPQDGTAAAPGTPVLKAYDLATGRQAASLRLDGLIAGSWTDPTPAATPSSEPPLVTMWSPGFALSPDSHTIAILDANRNALTTINSARMTIEKTVSLAQPQSPLDRLGHFLGLAPTTADAKELRGTSLTMRYSPDGQSLLVTGFEGKPDAQGRYLPSPLGLRRIDVASGEIRAEIKPSGMVYWLQYAPDGSALYALSPTSSSDDSLMELRRYDPSSLNLLATRQYEPQGGYSAPCVLLTAR